MNNQPEVPAALGIYSADYTVLDGRGACANYAETLSDLSASAPPVICGQERIVYKRIPVPYARLGTLVVEEQRPPALATVIDIDDKLSVGDKLCHVGNHEHTAEVVMIDIGSRYPFVIRTNVRGLRPALLSYSWANLRNQCLRLTPGAATKRVVLRTDDPNHPDNGTVIQ